MSEKETTTFHNEDAIFRIAMWANIVSWAALVFALLQFGNVAYSLYSQWDQFVMAYPEIFPRIAVLGNALFLEPLVGGVFAFLALRGVSQGLYLLMDLYMDVEEYDDFDEDEDEGDND
ncbi:MAG: hypothetical protein HN855_08675 [Anaerolineae bacterium]|jgi:hypothetical protein|nr:hypothetical protein [Anaerolineae bacterium]MBT7071692.1 hypothetical protein [Anaerolineae bacterium]MBT7325218.1 hypothetical protein [Anaerolineae bacterium]